MITHAIKISPPVAVSGAALAGWLEILTKYGQLAVIVVTLVYTLLQIVSLLRGWGKKGKDK